MCSGRASAMVTSPPAIPTAARYVAATTRSGTTGVTSRPERLDALDLNARRSRAGDHRPHVAQHRGQVGHLGLLGGVLDHRRALGQDRRHQQVVRRRVTGVLEHDPRADQPAPRHVPRTSPWDDSKRAPMAVRPLRWKSMGRSPKSSPPGIGTRTEPQRARRRPAPRSRPASARPARRGPRDQLALRRRGHARHPRCGALHRCSRAAQHVRHGVDVGDPRHVREDVAALGQEARRHQLENGILRTTGPDGAPERAGSTTI